MKQYICATLIVSLFLLSSCSKNGTPTPLPTVVLQDNQSALTQGTQGAVNSGNAAHSSGVTSSGVLISDQHVELAFLASGDVKELNVSVGQDVKKGDLLSQLDNSIFQSQLDQATLALNELTSPLAVSSAQKTVAEDKSALNTAQGVYNWWLAVNSDMDAASKAKADLVIAQDAQKKAQEDYDKLSGDPYSDKDKAVAYQHLYDAQQKVKEAQSKLALYNSADPYQLAIYKASVDVAKAKLDEDQILLSALTGGKLPENPTGDGYAKLMESRLNVMIAQTNLDHTKLVSPMDGIVSAINMNAGDFVSNGQIQMVIIDPKHIHVETTDLSERDIPGIKVGQSVAINIKPINKTITGKVIAISPQADSLGGDVIYKVFISIDSLPETALPGMSVIVNFKI
jgi:multidrug efflux pump subunit AcrA (membrane-fusion protein)